MNSLSPCRDKAGGNDEDDVTEINRHDVVVSPAVSELKLPLGDSPRRRERRAAVSRRLLRTRSFLSPLR